MIISVVVQIKDHALAKLESRDLCTIAGVKCCSQLADYCKMRDRECGVVPICGWEPLSSVVHSGIVLERGIAYGFFPLIVTEATVAQRFRCSVEESAVDTLS